MTRLLRLRRAERGSVTVEFALILPLALLIVFIAVAGFVWAARKGQFDDLDTPAMRIVMDDDKAPDDKLQR